MMEKKKKEQFPRNLAEQGTYGHVCILCISTNTYTQKPQKESYRAGQEEYWKK